MIKILCKWIGLTFMLVLAGCSNDEILATLGNDSDAELSEGNLVEIVLDKGEVTRTPRPLLYPDISGNNVNVVKLKMTFSYGSGRDYVSCELTNTNVTLKDNKGKVLNDYYVNGEWTLPWTSSEGSLDWNESHDDQMAIRIFGLENFEGLEKKPQLEIQAYGYHHDDTGSLPDGFSISGGVYSYSAPSTSSASSTSDEYTFLSDVDELFAGKNTVDVDNRANFTETAQVVLTRQVAGLMVCLKEVPVGTDVIELSLEGVATGCEFPSDLEYNTNTNGTVTDAKIKFSLPDGMSNYIKDGVYDFEKYANEHSDIFPIVPSSLKWYGGNPHFDEPLLFASFFLFACEQTTVKINSKNLKLKDGDKGFKRNHFYYIGTPENPASFKEIMGPGE